MGSEDTEKLNVDVAVDQGDARGDPRRLSFCAVGSQAPGTGLGLSGWEELQDVKRTTGASSAFALPASASGPTTSRPCSCSISAFTAPASSSLSALR